MLSTLPISHDRTPILWERPNVSKKPTPNQMVARQNFLRTLRQLRKDEECVLQEPLHEVRGQATQADANSEIKGLASSGRELYIIPDDRTLPDIAEIVRRSERVIAEYCPSNLNPPSVQLPRTISTELRDQLLGKSPLRLVVRRDAQFVPPATQPKYWIETLECSHQSTAYPIFYWDDSSHLINSIPTAKRRRCQECRELALPRKKPVQSVRDIPDKKAKNL